MIQYTKEMTKKQLEEAYFKATGCEYKGKNKTNVIDVIKSYNRARVTGNAFRNWREQV